jgi:hypothetical protein
VHKVFFLVETQFTPIEYVAVNPCSGNARWLSEIEVVDKTFEEFWMKPAYRVPDNDCACIKPGNGSRRQRFLPYRLELITQLCRHGLQRRNGGSWSPGCSRPPSLLVR